MNNLAIALQIIARRWPSVCEALTHASPIKPEVIHQPEPTYVIQGIQLTSCYNRQKEAQLQVEQIPEGATKVAIYGTALGNSITEVLKQKNIAQVHVFILNCAIFKLALTQHGLTEWLNDKRISLALGTDSTHIESPFIVSPSELILAERSCARLRDKLYLALDNDFIEYQHQDSIEAKKTIYTNMLASQTDQDATLLLSRLSKPQRIYVIAAGPSLEDSIHLLKDISSGDLIFAVDATLKALDQYEIMPDVVVSIDPNPQKCFEGVDLSKYQQCGLLYFPRMNTEVIRRWTGPRYCAYSTSSLYDEVNQKWPRLRLYTGGSVIHPTIDLAVKLGAQEVILLGADFGFPYPKTHAFWPSNFAVKSPDEVGVHTVENWHGDQITTMPNLRGYLRDLEDYIACQPDVDFYTTSPLGAKITGTKLW